MPVAWLLHAGRRFIGQRTLDTVGHVWTVWNTGQGHLTRSPLVAWPDGTDLLPILGGWLDIFIAGGLARAGLPLHLAWNGTLCLFLVVAGLGGQALARAFGASAPAALLAGLLLQLDPFVLSSISGGRSEQAGLGFVALALAGAILVWRRPGWGPVLLAGIFGASTIYVSWEHAFWLAFAMAGALPFFAWTHRRPGWLRGMTAAALLCIVTTGPWVALFLHRARQVRADDEGLQTMSWALVHSVPLLGWFVQSETRPSIAVLLAMLALPFVIPRRDRRLWVGVGLGLLLTWILAAGPSPGLWRVGVEADGFWGPYAWMQRIPLLGWFHTPDRLLVGWNLVGVVAAALLFDRVRGLLSARPRLGMALAILIGLGLGGTAWRHVQLRHLLPKGDWELPLAAVYRGPATVGVEGALLDLPPRAPGPPALQYQLLQMLHERPIPYHMTLPSLTTAREEKILALGTLAAATTGISPPGGTLDPATIREELQAMEELGYAFLAIHPQQLGRRRAREISRAIVAAVGPPQWEVPGDWLCWQLSPNVGAH